jgi:hypothetical protein
VGLRGDVEEVGPDVAAGGRGEFGVLHRDVNARLEGRVDVFHAVGREEKYSFIVLEDPQKDCDGEKTFSENQAFGAGFVKGYNSEVA